MDRNDVTPELRRRMNRAGLFFFVLALGLVGYLTHNFTKEYDPAVVKEAKLQKQRAAAERAEKSPNK
ncbi:MAG: hypothetical protein HQL88_03485 [Magnetococcales bacterium]|nr:hypothetical protein [Magnetococcales bacterium]